MYIYIFFFRIIEIYHRTKLSDKMFTSKIYHLVCLILSKYHLTSSSTIPRNLTSRWANENVRVPADYLAKLIANRRSVVLCSV